MSTTMLADERRQDEPSLRCSEAARMKAVRNSGLLLRGQTPRLATFVPTVAAALNRPLSFLSVADACTQHVRFGPMELVGTIPRAESICQHLIDGDADVMVVEDTLADPRFATLAFVTARSGIRFYAGSIVRSGDGHRLGALCVADRVPGRLSSEEAHVLRRATQELERLVEEHRAEQTDMRRMLADIGENIAVGPVPLKLQPIASIDTLRPAGFEALLRWRRPDGTTVRPDLLIPRLEATGLIFAVDRAVLGTACRRAAYLPDRLGISVNVSASWFHPGRERLPEAVESALRGSGLAPGRLTIEVTEQVMIRDARFAAETFAALKQLGVNLALDDFGTGYSSLSHLASYPFDMIKLDRSFAGSLGRTDKTDKLVTGVIQLGRAIGMRVCVEGVERESQLQFLRAQDCDLVQGFLIDDLAARVL